MAGSAIREVTASVTSCHPIGFGIVACRRQRPRHFPTV